MSGVRIIGIGQPFAGDDAVGLAVIAWLRARRAAGVELHEARDAAALIPLLADERPSVIVDALLDAPAGEVRELEVDALDRARTGALSSHGVGLRDAIDLARAVASSWSACPRIVGVTIALPARGEHRLSPEVAAAVPRAAALALTLALGARARAAPPFSAGG